MSTSSGHDALGRRVFKSNTAARYFAHDEQRKVIGEYDATSTLSETVWLGSTPLAVLRNGQTYWVDADQIDTPRAVLDASNQIVWRWRSEAFGNAQAEEDPSGLGAFEFNHRFPGQMFDKESALHHNDHRDYRAHTGRYIESDPVGLVGGHNRYAYGEGNPVSKIDPFGLETFLCNRPLDGFHGVSVGPLFHQFLCTLGANGKVKCGGLGPRNGSDGMFGGAGKIEAEASVRPEQCKKVRELDQCFERCVDNSLASPAPNYDVRAGRPWLFPKSSTQQCQVYTESVLGRCSVQCGK